MMEVTGPGQSYVKLGVLDETRTNLKLSLAKKLPEKPMDELYDPMVQGRNL